MDIRQPDDAHYPNSDELLSIGSPLGQATGLTHVGVHHELLPPGRRTSYPHAEADEDEFVYVLEGAPSVWIDGELHALSVGDAVGFPAGTGIAHSFLNDTSGPVRLLVVGEASKPHHRIHYPLHPERNDARASTGRHWDQAPPRSLGPHDGKPKHPPVTLGVPTLQTARLVLRPHRIEDAEAIFEMRSHPEATRFLSGGPPSDLATEQARLRRVITRVDALEMLGWTITLPRSRASAVDGAERAADDDRFVGLVGIVRIDRKNAKAEIGYELDRAHWGKGIMREAVAKVVEHGFGALGLHRLEIRTDAENERSIRVALVLGFEKEGVLRHDERGFDGSFRDTVVFSKLAPG